MTSSEADGLLHHILEGNLQEVKSLVENEAINLDEQDEVSDLVSAPLSNDNQLTPWGIHWCI